MPDGADRAAGEDARPFADVRVVEFGQFVSVPFCGQMLAEGGATVIKVEALTGDPTRLLRQIAPLETRIFLSRNRGKRSLPLALRERAAKPVIDRLLGWADVALMNFRPGLDRELGLDPDTLRRRFPRLVTGSVTAFGKQGPEANLAGMDIVVQARTGLMAANGRVVDGRPAPGDPVSADYMCAMSLAFGIASALLRRERTGVGGAVDVSLMQAAMTLANNQLVRSEREDAAVHEEVLARLERQRRDGAGFVEQGRGMSSARAMPLLKVYFRTYDTADVPVAVACGSRALRVRFLEVVGAVDEELDAPGNEHSHGYYDRLRAEIEDTMRAEPGAHWISRLRAAGVPVSAVKFPVELFDDEHVRANGMLYTFPHPEAGDVTAPAPPVRLDGDGFRPREPTAAFASETRDLLAELGFSAAETEALIEDGVTRERGEPHRR